MGSKYARKIIPVWAKRLWKRCQENAPYSRKASLARSVAAQERKKKSNALVKKLYDDDVITVLNGPFQGMRYIDTSNGSQLLPKLVGTYEEPIHEWVYEILEKGKYTTIIDVGCAEGYYAVGLSKAKSRPKIYAFDVDKEALENAKKLAEINGVSDVICFHELFEPSAVATLFEADSAMKALIFMDVEGAELDLLNTSKAPAILNCDVLVELHDCFYPSLTELILEQFHESHKIKIVVDYPWRAEDYFLNGKIFSKEDVRLLLDERRPKGMRWMYARRK